MITKGASCVEKGGQGGLGVGNVPSAPDASKSEKDSLWEKLSLQLVDSNSTKWFEDLGVTSASKIFEDQLSLQGKMLTAHTVFLDEDDAEDQGLNGILEVMEVSPGELGERENLETTLIGKAVTNFLEQNELNYSFKNMWPISHRQQVEVDSNLRLEGQWGN